MKPPPIPVPPPAVVVPSSDAHCLTQPPPKIPLVVEQLRGLPPDGLASHAQVEDLANAYADTYEYAQRAWVRCGTVAP